jgi:glycosyltransferase involved in cell wall biosynthesis
MERATLALLASFSGNGGVERMLVNLLRALAARDMVIDLLLLRADSAYLRELPDEKIRQHPLAGRHSILAIPALARYLRRARPEVLLVAKDRAGRSAVIARALAGVKIPIVLRLGTHLSTAMAGRLAPERWLRYSLIRWLYPHLEAVVAVSAGVAQDVRAVARLPEARVRVIRNPVITPELFERAAAPCPHPWLGEAQSIPVILGLGRLQRQKDFPTLIRAFARLRRERPARLLILGEGGGRADLQQQIASLGLEADIALPGFVANPYSWLARADLFVLSSAWEGSPNALTEALALGTPVVATDCPSGPAEILQRGRYGCLAPVGDAPALARAMAHTLDQPLAPEPLRAAVVEYQAEHSADCYLALLQELGGQRVSEFGMSRVNP